MAGRRLLDAAALVNASRSIARQHFRLREEQLDVWQKTSTVAKAIKSQTDRVTLTAAAASALSSRLNEVGQNVNHIMPTHQTHTTKEPSDLPRSEGLEQDHHYEPSPENTVLDPPSTQDLDLHQERARTKPTPDGSVPPIDSPINVDGDTLQTSKTSAVGDMTDRPSLAVHEAVPEQDEVPEGVNTDVFHSPRISRMLGGRKRPGELGLGHSVGTPIDVSPQAKGRDQDTFNVRKSGASVQEEVQPDNSATDEKEDIGSLAKDIASDVENKNDSVPASTYHMRESRVPSSRFGRIWEYSGLATSMAFGAVGETFRRVTGGESTGSLMLSASNMERLVAKLSKMRGAALKLGQIMSFQDSKVLPAPIYEVLQRVQDNADYMPAYQRDQVLSANLGTDWKSLFATFEEIPMAAASIGQVHRATLASNNTPVAVKIQYPGVAQSISSDLNNLSILLTASRLLPKGLYLDKTIANARTELAWECDYEREAQCQMRFRDLLAGQTDTFVVPKVFSEASGKQVLTAEMMQGTGVTKKSLELSQSQRDWIGTQILRLCLQELTEFKFMQTDPNWTNFLFNKSTQKLELLDFGAAREYPDKFIDPYIQILIAASHNDRQTIRDLSVQLGYLTGHESKAMENAHVDSVLTLSEPFKADQDPMKPYDFKDQTVTDRVRSFIPVMLRERLAPPPEETYSLHRKLSGAFLLLARLGSRVKCRDIFEQSIQHWKSQRQTT